MGFSKWLAIGSFGILLAASPVLAAHPGSSSDCLSCHKIGTSGEAPKVSPEEPGFFAKLFEGKKSLKGHPSVSCAGGISADGKVTGCHAPEKGFRKFLAEDLTNKATDIFCARCHPGPAKFGAHHPSYQVDKNGDGVGDSLVSPVAMQEVFSTFAPDKKGLPLSKYPDSLVLITQPDGTKKLDVALPLEKVAVTENGREVLYAGVISCTTCHNPHFGFLVESGKEEEVKADLVARPKGDALLRMRDFDNQLCLACH